MATRQTDQKKPWKRAAQPGKAGRPSLRAEQPAGPPKTKRPVPPKAKAEEPQPQGARISRRAADRLRQGHLWVYKSDIERLVVPEGEPPALVSVADNRGLLLGTALLSPTSLITLRMIAREVVSDAQWLEMLEQRLRKAIARRKTLLDADNDSCRLCFSEADELPGIVVDKYGETVIVQLLTRGLDSASVRERVVRALVDELNPATIVDLPDPRMRELEGLSAPSAEPLYKRKAKRGAAASSTGAFLLNGLSFHYDAAGGQKTGAFLDQRTNYAAAAGWAERLGANGRALDVCCYQGGFALHLARVCRQVTGIDVSRASLEVAERNLETNRALLTAEVDWVEGNAFDVLRDWAERGEQFDTIVLDPPAFAKSQRAVEGALRGYKELNLRALKMLRPGGLLISCSCSHHVSGPALEGAVASAASDARRRVRILERRGAALDHPVILNLPETEYLKCLVLEVE